jgi:hypothetical protein
MALVVILTSVIDWIIDSFITPRIMASTLKVHPAAVLVAAIVAANLLGLLGVVIAAPFLASVTLLGRYTMRKMLDLNPWPEKQERAAPPLGADWLRRIRNLLSSALTGRKAPEKNKAERLAPAAASSEPEPATVQDVKTAERPRKSAGKPARTRISRATANRSKNDKSFPPEEQRNEQ